jgi:signal transduction histidine kinase
MPEGRVALLPGPTYRDIVREFGPSMGLLAGSLLTVGAVAIALVVFGPTRRRLKQVQDASERLGAGDPSARAPEEGGDEVSALARSFNRMADELTNRARALESSDKARRQLLADVSHELMTPLTAMRGYIETLAMPDRHARFCDTRALRRNHRGRNAPHGAHHRRPARPGAARRRRDDDETRACGHDDAVRSRGITT